MRLSLNGFQYRQWCPRDYNDHGTERRMVARRLVSLGQQARGGYPLQAGGIGTDYNLA